MSLVFYKLMGNVEITLVLANAKTNLVFLYKGVMLLHKAVNQVTLNFLPTVFKLCILVSLRLTGIQTIACLQAMCIFLAS